MNQGKFRELFQHRMTVSIIQTTYSCIGVWCS